MGLGARLVCRWTPEPCRMRAVLCKSFRLSSALHRLDACSGTSCTSMPLPHILHPLPILPPLIPAAGDDVDPGNIIAGGRRARRGRAGGDARPKYSAKAQLDSDEDEW